MEAIGCSLESQKPAGRGLGTISVDDLSSLLVGSEGKGSTPWNFKQERTDHGDRKWAEKSLGHCRGLGSGCVGVAHGLSLHP